MKKVMTTDNGYQPSFPPGLQLITNKTHAYIGRIEWTLFPKVGMVQCSHWVQT